MIEITFNPKKYEVSLKGHAEVAKKGEDIVCSAVSILFYTLCESVTKQKQYLAEEPHIVMEEGDGSISCKPTKEGQASISHTYWTVLNGFLLLAESYPEAVSVK